MYDAFYPGQVWLDTNGNRIQAHGGSLIYLDGVYYWYGENKEKTDKAAGIWHWGVRYYASTDLYNWEDRGLLIPPVTDDPNSSLHPTSMMDRPHIIYNARTKKYVCWLKIMEKDQTQTETVLTADSFFGPYTIVREKLRPLGMSAGDFDLAVAPDGKAYYFFERVHSETIIADLTEDYTDVTGYYSTHFPHKGPPHVREATAHFIRHGKHYLLTSGTTGYFPNPSEAAMADTWHGPYTVQGDPHIGDKTKTSFHSQISSVFKVPNKKDLYIACADRWMPNAPDYDYTHYGPLYDRLFDPDVEKTPADWALLANLPQEDTRNADYVWLPILFDGDNVKIEWRDSWKLEDTKNLHITSELINKHLVLEFEGVYCMTTVTVNDRPAAEKAYGYTPFTVELDGLLREGDNTIEVTAHVPQDGHNRWYTGGGIYRPVHLLVGEDAYIERYGVRVTTLSVAPACVRVEVMTHGGDCAEVRIAEKNGKEVVCAKAVVADGRAVVELEIPDAKLWNAEHPNLYLAEVTLYSGGKAVDTVTESFGLRVIEIDPARGLLINGEPTFLRGGCIHNDMGVIGVINNDATELHRARNIKKAGFNAIRSAHHPMSRSLMKACDEVGLYVMDEAFDYWYRMKSPNSPYNRYFMQDFKVDTAAMVQDAYNHPSVVIYSIGNEIPEAGGVKGVRVGKEIVDAIHALDTTRPTTLCPSVHWLREYLDGTPYLTTDEDEWMRDDPERKKSDWMHYASIFRSAVNNLPDNEKGQVYPETYIRMDEDATKNLYPYLDIAGYNYYEDRYEVLHKLHPERVLLGTETRHTMLPDTMKFAKTHPYLIGDFVWTLQSHLGEINCCDLHYEENEEHKSYPWVTNHGGVLDLTGQAEPSLHRYEFIWGGFLDKPVHALYLASQPPVHNGKPPIATSYRWTDTVDGWTYEGYEGKRTFVDAYTDADSVEIFINGKSAGKAQVKDYFAKIPCIYEPGELVGVGYDADGHEIYRTSVRTADAETVLTVKTDKNILRAGGQDFCFADVYVTDKNGTVKLLPDYDVKIEVVGAASLQGYGSAAYKNAEHYDQHHHKSWQGHLQAVLRSTEKTGPVTVTFTADGCAPAILHLSAE